MITILVIILCIVGYKTLWYGTTKERKRIKKLLKDENKKRP